MLARSVRSGLAETHHDGVVCVCDADGRVVASSGDIDRPFYLRSSAKPFQAAVSRRHADLTPLQLALACASHRGLPAHTGIVHSTLERYGLTEADLRCPPSWLLSDRATRMLWRAGHDRPRRIWHNCSGKHAGFLAACVAEGWPTDTYLDPGHPLQREIVEFVSEIGSHDVTPVGVDGCGAPVLRTTARAMATMFARLATDPSLFDVYTAMHRYPALVAANGEGDAAIATAVDAVAKGGAQGCIGVGLRSGLGVAVKSWDGNHEAAVVAAVAVLEQVGAIGGHPVSRLGEWARRPVLGGGREVGALEPLVELDREKSA
ncbi:MAG: asparaginase [Actinomycetes bacterium]